MCWNLSFQPEFDFKTLTIRLHYLQGCTGKCWGDYTLPGKNRFSSKFLAAFFKSSHAFSYGIYSKTLHHVVKRSNFKIFFFKIAILSTFLLLILFLRTFYFGLWGKYMLYTRVCPCFQNYVHDAKFFVRWVQCQYMLYTRVYFYALKYSPDYLWKRHWFYCLFCLSSCVCVCVSVAMYRCMYVSMYMNIYTEHFWIYQQQKSGFDILLYSQYRRVFCLVTWNDHC